MTEYCAEVLWQRGEHEAFTDARYSRAHRWHFDGGTEVPASSSPKVVPLPYSDEHAVDPEEAFIASLSSCHMLWFLSLAAQAGFVVQVYRDQALGVLGRDASGRTMITQVTLRPEVAYSGVAPDPDKESALHHSAHEQCFVANSVRTEIRIKPVFVA